MSEAVESFAARLPDLARHLEERGSLGVVLLDATALGDVEYDYGREAFEEVRQRVLRLVGEHRQKEHRAGDLLTVDEPRGLRFLLFLDRKRRKGLPVGPADIRAARARLLPTLLPTLTRAAFPYVRMASPVGLGHALAFHNPLVHPARTLQRALDEAEDQAEHERTADRLQMRERLQEVLLRDRITTAYQPILNLRDRTLLGFEALSRGPRGTALEPAASLFGAAEANHLLVELDRLCRRRAFLSSGRIASSAKIFVNTLPAAVRDPEFRGKPLIDFLAQAQVAPSRIVLEITEKLVIESYGLFREAMTYFTDLGMSFAVDDVGAGYSGLESIARLKPSYLKIDIALVRGVHESVVNREMVKAIVALGRGIAATVVAEGIQAEEEAAALRALGVEGGQGYLLGRPDPGPE